jgi:N-acetylglucosaminyl-diphospho-decaprenol L-rhamnosyltransferase
MRLAIVLVHYHTPALAAAAVEALRRSVEEAGLDADADVEWLLVDNGSDDAGRALLESLPVRRIDPGTNLGYAGGVNLGVARSSAGQILLMNPDVLVRPGCVPALLAALDAGAGIAGPQSFWDEERRLLLPPAEPRSRRDEIAALLAGRGPRLAERARRRWRRHARRHWQARGPLPSWTLSGSLLALRREAWDRTGPFDPAFPLFFEETDWLLRAHRKGVPVCYVPAAEAVHLHGRSAVGEPRSSQWFEESARRFRERWYGVWFADLLEALARRLPARPDPREEAPAAGLDLSGFRFPLWIELSPNPAGFPAAAERLAAPVAGGWRLPGEVVERIAGTRLAVQVVDDAGRELARYLLRVGGAG